MTDNEANKIIADFMGRYSNYVGPNLVAIDGMLCLFTSSLDSLIHVWEKANMFSYFIFDFGKIGTRFEFEIYGDRDHNIGKIYNFKEDTLARAAAYATAKAILELKDE